MDLTLNKIYTFRRNVEPDIVYAGKYIGIKRGFYLFEVKGQIIPIRRDYLEIL